MLTLSPGPLALKKPPIRGGGRSPTWYPGLERSHLIAQCLNLGCFAMILALVSCLSWGTFEPINFADHLSVSISENFRVDGNICFLFELGYVFVVFCFYI